MSTVALSSRASAAPTEEGWQGAFIPMIAFLGAVPGILPALLLISSKAPGVGTIGLDFGAGQRATSFAMGLDMGAYPDGRLPFGFIGRSHLDVGGRAHASAIRLDALVLLAMAGNIRGPLVLEGIGGLTVTPRWESKGYLGLGWYAAIGPTIGTRIRSIAMPPRIPGWERSSRCCTHRSSEAR
ncbi:hypothetical protein A7982_13223 [Minicystis rosea]|nr:hypothetical protein A7982_13223 [Minicystis rosea]